MVTIRDQWWLFIHAKSDDTLIDQVMEGHFLAQISESKGFMLKLFIPFPFSPPPLPPPLAHSPSLFLLGELAIHDTRYSGIAGHDINDDMCVCLLICVDRRLYVTGIFTQLL